MINVHNAKVKNFFVEGDVVFKVTTKRRNSPDTDIHMVTTKEDYQKCLSTHEYSPLLFTSDFPTRLAYLYGCLNNNYNTPRSETFTFWWRRLKERKWSKWFTVHPYKEHIIHGTALYERGE